MLRSQSVSLESHAAVAALFTRFTNRPERELAELLLELEPIPDARVFPLIVSDEEIDELHAATEATLDELAASA